MNVVLVWGSPKWMLRLESGCEMFTRKHSKGCRDIPVQPELAGRFLLWVMRVQLHWAPLSDCTQHTQKGPFKGQGGLGA